MPNKLKREIFRRNIRMVHRFDINETQDPFASPMFDPGVPIGIGQRQSRPLNIQSDGEYRFFDPQSPILKHDGKVASTNGPSPDESDPIAQTIPANTIKRKAPT